MNRISFSKNKASLCYRNTCISATGDVAKAITYTVACVVVISGIASLFNTASK
ncbi:conserved hypothetical protein [Tenacibaculum maritimum]|uniref:hypothetical protein n=1 Tax=Tenacibaculum maritimum TaxID=107401 RepID=UPI0012E41BE3|nr:hypothetical protein [Tenacibaculum maritimum]CAA0163166.1 conserved hypothetical protein [Tenacibaculum maritimum]CAA0173399.1 conserved hypothetical protein [Tenacibaculum maritimum]